MKFNQVINSFKESRLPKKEEDKLILMVQSGGAESVSACNRLVEANQYWAAQCAHNFQFSQLDFDDLFVHALEGLWKSISSYDVNSDVPLAAYANKAMIQSILDGINSVGNAHGNLPVAIQRDLKRLNIVSKKLREELEYEPSVEELSLAMNVEVEYVSYLLSLTQRIVSLDDDEKPFEPGVEDENLSEAADDKTTSPKKSFTLKQILPPFDYDVFVRSRGLDGFKPMTHQEILNDINRIRAKEGKQPKTMEDVSIHYNRAVLLDRCFD